MREMTPEQQFAVDFHDGTLLLLAGPGFGQDFCHNPPNPCTDHFRCFTGRYPGDHIYEGGGDRDERAVLFADLSQRVTGELRNISRNILFHPQTPPIVSKGGTHYR